MSKHAALKGIAGAQPHRRRKVAVKRQGWTPAVRALGRIGEKAKK